MKSSNALWKERLSGRIPTDLGREIDIFETEIALRQSGKIEEKIFAETRLRRGAYGQRYDNGQRHDGKDNKPLRYPKEQETKGPNTVWDAPGMQRIKIPFGGLNALQLEVMAELAEEYSDGIVHITTRQDFQLHYIHIDDTPSLMRRLASVDITTREACGNSVRNVTACPFSGVCADETFDVTPYAKALSKFLLGHPDCQNFGRKFKPSFSGCRQHSCGLTSMHDIGGIATTKTINGIVVRGFEFYVGGGLGAVPHKAKLFSSFLPVEELLPISQAIARVFARLGEKKNRNRARIKFLVQDLGIEKFKALVEEERKTLAFDPRWTEYIKKELDTREEGLKGPGIIPKVTSPVFLEWLKTNVRQQKQDGYSAVTITLPLGDITADQLRGLANIVRKYTRETIRTTVEQNIVIRWVSHSDLFELYDELDSIKLGQPGASNIVDIVACPGTDTCKLGISSSRGLAAVLKKDLDEKSLQLNKAIKDLHIKISGCFNSCGQHHVGDMGFYGVSRKINGFAVPHFQVVLGGHWEGNAESFGLPMVAIPSKNIPKVVLRLAEYYVDNCTNREKFQAFVQRCGKAKIRTILEDLIKVPSHEVNSSYYSDWGDPREYSLDDLGKGECAGEVVTAVEFDLAAAERKVFEAQVLAEQGGFQDAGRKAYEAMLRAAKGLVHLEEANIGDDSDEILNKFKTRFYDTQKIFDPFAGGKFASYLFAAHRTRENFHTSDSSRRLIEEAQLFIEASHSCYNRIGSISPATNN